MKDRSEEQVTNKMFYEGQVQMMNNLKQFGHDLKEELKQEVRGQIQITVNGKIDEIKKGQVMTHRILEDQDAVLKTITARLARTESVIDPILERQKAFKIFGSWFTDIRSFVLYISSIIGALTIIWVAFFKR